MATPSDTESGKPHLDEMLEHGFENRSMISDKLRNLITLHADRMCVFVETSTRELEAEIAQEIQTGRCHIAGAEESHDCAPFRSKEAYDPFFNTSVEAHHKDSSGDPETDALQRLPENKDKFDKSEKRYVDLKYGVRKDVTRAHTRSSSNLTTGARKSRSVFADAADMKEKIRKAVCRKEYSVTMFYHETGYSQMIARSSVFENISLLIIALNAIWIAVDTDYNTEDLLLDAELHFVIMENLFCAFFTFEWIVRFAAFKDKRFCVRDAWFCFDTLLFLTMVTETWVMTLIFAVLVQGGSSQSLGNTQALKLVRLIRLTRMARMARLLRAVPELIILIKGLAVASRSVFFTLVLLVIIIYLFAIIFTQLIGQLAPPNGTPNLQKVYFSSVGHSMATLVFESVIPDMSKIVRDCSAQSSILGFLILFFVLMSSLTVMNMLVGVLCEVVSVVSAVEKEQMTVNYVKSKLLAVFSAQKTYDTKITKEDFETLLLEPHAARVIQEIGVDVVGLVDFSDYIFQDGRVITFATFMDIVLQLRGTNNSTVKDIVDLRRYMLREFTKVNMEVSVAARSIQSAARALGNDCSKEFPQFRVGSEIVGNGDSTVVRDRASHDCKAHEGDLCKVGTHAPTPSAQLSIGVDVTEPSPPTGRKSSCSAECTCSFCTGALPPPPPPPPFLMLPVPKNTSV